MRGPLRLLVLLVPLVLGPATVHGNALIADLSKHLVAITTGFTGADVLLFGAIEEDGDIAVVVRGPSEEVVVRRKHQIAGIWANGRSLTFGDVPAYYAVAATGNIDKFAPASVLLRHQIGAGNLRLQESERTSEEEVAEFREALLRAKERRGLFPAGVGRVSVLSDRLFRTQITFPSNVPTGTYIVEVFMIQDRMVASAQTTPLIVSRVGTEAWIFDFAHKHAALYGIVAILIALVAGWLAGAIFRKA